MPVSILRRTQVVRGLAAASGFILLSAYAETNDFRLDLTPKPPAATVEDYRRERFEQHYDCLAGRGDARSCEMLEQQARQKQIDAARQGSSPAPLTPPVRPDELPARGIPLPGGR